MRFDDYRPETPDSDRNARTARAANSFGPLTREQFQRLAAAPCGMATQYLFDPWGMAKDELVTLAKARLSKVRCEPIADIDWVAAEADDLVADMLVLLEHWKLISDAHR